MWRMPAGDRTLKGSDWELFREGLAALAYRIDKCRDDDTVSTDVPDFESLDTAGKLEALALAGEALSDESLPAPLDRRCVESAILAVYSYILGRIAGEIADTDWMQSEGSPLVDDHWRRLALGLDDNAVVATNGETEAAATPEGYDPEDEVDPWEGGPPDPECRDIQVWELVIQEMKIRVLGTDGLHTYLDPRPNPDHLDRARVRLECLARLER